jgi:hypothetical protein
VEIFPEVDFEVTRFHPFIDHGTRDVDVLPQGVHIVPAEKKAVKKRSFALRR